MLPCWSTGAVQVPNTGTPDSVLTSVTASETPKTNTYSFTEKDQFQNKETLVASLFLVAMSGALVASCY